MYIDFKIILEVAKDAADTLNLEQT